jgi:hydrogenase expression/formation protein HypE
LVMGAKPIGISLSYIIEEGFGFQDLKKINSSIDELSVEYGIPIATGDTKVMPRGKLDKIVINTSGVGLVEEKNLLTKKINVGDKIIISGGIGEHAVALLSKRFDYETKIKTDSKPLVNEFNDVRDKLKISKDPTRGGLAAVLNEICSKNGCGILIDEEKVPFLDEVKKVVDMLGINLYELACEGRFVGVVSPEDVSFVLDKLKKFNSNACEIGEIVSGDKVLIQTILGQRILPVPTGRIVPRIC